MLIYIAQTAETAEKALTWVERVVQGGPSIILGMLVLSFGAVIYFQNKKIRDLEREYRKTLESQISTAIENTEKLISTITLNTSVIESNGKTLRGNHDTMTRINARLDQDERRGA